MRPKGKLFALVVMFAAVGLLTATGAFTTVEAERTATVDVAGDSSALLALQANSTYADNNAGGGSQLQINLNSADVGNSAANGLNPNANTTFDYILNVTNNGDNDVTLSVNINPQGSSIQSENVLVTNSSDGTDLTSGSVTLTPGQTADVDLKIALTSGTGNQVDELGSSEDITITFVANEA